MRFIRALLLFTALIAISTDLASQNSYQGVLVSKLGGRQEGMITVNLGGPNSELIEIKSGSSTTEKKKNRKTRETVTTSMSLNVALISYIIINDSTYYFRDIKTGYDDQYEMNVCVRLIEGNINCGMFQYGNAKEEDKIAVKLPNESLSKLVSVDFDYYLSTLGWHIMNFGKCASLNQKMHDKQEGYTWNDNTPRSERIAIWKKWIREFNNCI